MKALNIDSHDCQCNAPLFANESGDLCCTACDFVLKHGGDNPVDTSGYVVHFLDDVISRNWFVNEWLKVKYDEEIPI